MIQIERNLHIIKLQKICKTFTNSDLLPTVLRMQLENYKTVQGLVSQFVKQKAVFHKTCMNKYDGHNFKQKVKTKIINTSSSSPVETPLGEFCSLQIILITVFFFL